MDEVKRQQIAAIRALPSQLREAVQNLDDAQLDTPYRKDGWTIRQVVHHLADSHMHAYLRMKFMVTEDHPAIKPYNQDIWAELTDARSGPIQPSLVILMGLHERWASFLENVPDVQWTRGAMHPERGEVTFASTAATYAAHGQKHLGQIRTLREAKGWK